MEVTAHGAGLVLVQNHAAAEAFSGVFELVQILHQWTAGSFVMDTLYKLEPAVQGAVQVWKTLKSRHWQALFGNNCNSFGIYSHEVLPNMAQSIHDSVNWFIYISFGRCCGLMAPDPGMGGGGGEGILPYISYIVMCGTRGYGFEPFWSERGYVLCTLAWNLVWLLHRTIFWPKHLGMWSPSQC